jgi:hypothetical protein
MAERTVTDSAGRTWTCVTAPAKPGEATNSQGKDVVLTCVTPSVTDPVLLTIGWQWEKMAPNGLARMIALASPVPRS